MSKDPTPKPAADDVAADMEHRLEDLGEQIHDSERKARHLPDEPLSAIAGDQTLVHEGPLSRGATPAGAKELEPEQDD